MISVVNAVGTVGEYAFILKTGSAVSEVMSTDAGYVVSIPVDYGATSSAQVRVSISISISLLLV